MKTSFEIMKLVTDRKIADLESRLAAAEADNAALLEAGERLYVVVVDMSQKEWPMTKQRQ